MFDTVESALADLKLGKLIIVCDDESRENEGDLVGLAEGITPQIINFMITHGRGLVCMPIAPEYAERLNIQHMVQENTDNFKTAFTVSIDHKSNSTGISAFDRAQTINKVLDEDVIATDFRRPGHIFPLLAKAKGVFERMGHTEAVVDLARLCGKKPAGVLCEIIKEDGQMARRDDLVKFAKKFDLKFITVKDILEYRKRYDKLVKSEAHAQLPTKLGDFEVIAYSNTIDDCEHIALIKGDIASYQNPLVRLHSECLTGDVFHSLRCDCGEQLDLAMSAIEKEGSGIIIYMRQEGRGIGLINKLKAYELQQGGLDTVDANTKLGFADDLREYFLASQILRDLGVKQIRLLTNNLAKVEALEQYGIEVVERIMIKTVPNPANQNYLHTKATKLKHVL